MPTTKARPVLSLRELNRALLARQLRRVRLSPPDAIERPGSLQAQWPAAPYVALWSRLQGFTIGALGQALEERSVVKATVMRGTLHLWAFIAAYGGLVHVPASGAWTARGSREVVARWGARLAGRTAVLAIATLQRLGAPDRTAVIAEGEGLIRLIHPDARAHQVRFVSGAGLPLANLSLRP